MADTQTHHGHDALHDSSFMFSGSYDDSSFCRGSQCLKPIATSFKPKHKAATAAAASPSSYPEAHDCCAVLDDEDEVSEDELPTSPKRRHSGAMSISSEDLPFCYDRAALRRDTAAHRARHHEQREQLRARGRVGTGASVAHETWDTALDGPPAWVPDHEKTQHGTRRRVGQSALAPSPPSQERKEARLDQVSEIDGRMMALWGV